MNYKIAFDSIATKLDEYCKQVDSMCACYKAEKEGFEKNLEAMRGTYTDNYIEQTKKNWKPKLDYAAEMQQRRTQTETIILFHLKSVRNRMNRFYEGALNMEIANKLTTAKALGIKLTAREMEALQKQSKSYFDRKMVAAYAAELGYPHREVADLDVAARAYEAYEAAVKGCLNRYCGKDASLYDFIGDTSLIAQGNKAVAQATCLSVANILKDDSTTRKNIVGIMDELEEIDGNQRANELTKEETAFINAILPEEDFKKYPGLTKARAVEIAKTNEDIAVLLAMDSRYGDVVTEAMQK